MTYGEILNAVFPLLDGKDLASCMRVCKQWRDIARDDYFWKCSCAKRWPSICKRPTPLPVSYRELFQKFRKRVCRGLNVGPNFSFDDLEFYIDIWDVPFNKERLVFSEVVSGSVLGGGIKDLPPDVAELHMSYLDGDGYKMIIPVEPKFSFMHDTIRVSVLVSRRDTNKLACIFDKWEFMIDKYDEEKEVLSEWVPGSVFQGGIKDLPPEYCYRMVLPVEREFNILNETVIVSVSGGQGGTNNMVCIFRKSEFGELKSELEPLGYDIERLPDISDVRAWVTMFSMYNKWVEDWDYFVAGISLDFDDAVVDEYDFLALLDLLLDWD